MKKMDIYSALKNEKCVRTLAKQVIQMLNTNFMEKSVEVILQFMVDMMKVTYKIDLANSELETFASIVLCIASDYAPQNLQNREFTKLYDPFITELCKTAQSSEAIYTAWFQKIMIFLLELRTNKALEAVAARLSLPFLNELNEIRWNLIQLVKLRSRAEDSNTNAQNEVEQIQWLDEYCDALYKMTTTGLSYKDIAKKIVNNLCLLNENSSTFYMKSQDCLAFYVQCLKIKNYDITIRALTSIKFILSDENLSKDEKMVVINYLVQQEPSLMLSELIFEKSFKMVEKTLEVINLIHEFVTSIPSWGYNEYCQTYLKMFHTNLSVRKLSGQFFLKRCMNDAEHDGDVLIEILELYFKYQPTKDNLVTYIDTLWDFEYMKNFDNILALLESGLNEDSAIIVSNFIVALIKRMLEEYERYQENIINLLRKYPLILESLQNDTVAFNILLEVLLLVDLKLYDPLHIGNRRYLGRLIKCLSDTFEKNNDCYLLLKYIFHILNKLGGLHFSEAQREISDHVQGAYSKFLEVFSLWEPLQDNVNSDKCKILSGSVYKMSIIASHIEYLDNVEEDQLLTILENNLIIKNNFLEVFKDIEGGDRTEAIAIKLMSDLLKRKIFQIIKLHEELFPQIELLRNKTEEFLSFLKGAIIREEKSLFFSKHVFEALIYIMLATQKKLSYSPYCEIRNLVIPVTSEDYWMIADFVSRVFSLAEEENELFTLEAKRNILQNFIMFHQKHIGLPFTIRTWKVVIYFGCVEEFDDQLIMLLKSLLIYETPKERKGQRFCNIFAAVLFNLGEKEIPAKNIEDIIKKYANIFCCELQDDERDFMIAACILNLIERLAKKIEMTERLADSVNRLKILKHLRHLVVSINNREKYKFVIKRELKELNRGLVTEEFDTLKQFEAIL